MAQHAPGDEGRRDWFGGHIVERTRDSMRSGRGELFLFAVVRSARSIVYLAAIINQYAGRHSRFCPASVAQAGRKALCPISRVHVAEQYAVFSSLPVSAPNPSSGCGWPPFAPEHSESILPGARAHLELKRREHSLISFPSGPAKLASSDEIRALRRGRIGAHLARFGQLRYPSPAESDSDLDGPDGEGFLREGLDINE